MPARAQVYEIAQWGVESSPGTHVAANRKLDALSVAIRSAPNIGTFRPEGSKFNTAALVGKESSTLSIEGVACYRALAYLLSGVLNYPTPSQQGGTIAYKWAFQPATSAADTVKAYTIEKGSSVRAERVDYGLISGVSLSFNAKDDRVAVSAEGIATERVDDITLTATPTVRQVIPITPLQVTIKLADAQANLAGASALTKVVSWNWSISGKVAPAFFAGSAASYAGYVENAPDMSGSLTLEADATAMAMLPIARAGTRYWMNVKFVGPLIAGSYYNTFDLTMPFYFGDVGELGDSDGLVAVTFNMTNSNDSTWGKALTIDLTNDLSGL